MAHDPATGHPVRVAEQDELDLGSHLTDGDADEVADQWAGSSRFEQQLGDAVGRLDQAVEGVGG